MSNFQTLIFSQKFLNIHKKLRLSLSTNIFYSESTKCLVSMLTQSAFDFSPPIIIHKVKISRPNCCTDSFDYLNRFDAYNVNTNNF